MGQLPSTMLPDEHERTPLQRQLAPADRELKRERDQSHIPVALRPDVARLQVQVGRPRSARPRLLEETPPARFDRRPPGNSVRCVAERKKDRRLRRPACAEWLPVEIVQRTQKSLSRLANSYDILLRLQL
jgi:hypothetical protein